MGQSCNCGMTSLDDLSSCWRWALKVPSPYCQAFHLRSLPLSLWSLSPPRSLVHSGGSPQPPSSLPVYILSAGPQGFNTRSGFPVPHSPLASPSTFLPRFLPPFPQFFYGKDKIFAFSKHQNVYFLFSCFRRLLLLVIMVT